MSSGIREVQTLIEALIPKLVISTDPLSAQAIGNMLYGLQNMAPDNAVVLGLLDCLQGKLLQSNAVLNGQELGNAM